MLRDPRDTRINRRRVNSVPCFVCPKEFVHALGEPGIDDDDDEEEDEEGTEEPDSPAPP